MKKQQLVNTCLMHLTVPPYEESAVGRMFKHADNALCYSVSTSFPKRWDRRYIMLRNIQRSIHDRTFPAWRQDRRYSR